AVAVDVELQVGEAVGPAVDDLHVADGVLLREGRPLVPGVAADDVDDAVVVDVEGRHGNELGLGVEDVFAKYDVPGRARRGQKQCQPDHQPSAAVCPQHGPSSQK